MFKKLTFGQYVYKDSITHKLDPRLKILSVVALSTITFFLQSYYKLAIFSLFIFLLICLSKISFSSLIRNIKPFFFIFSFILIMYLLFSRNELERGILAVWRFILLICIASILTFTTTITNMVTAIEKILAPMRAVKISPRTISLLIALTIRFIPSLFLYADRIKDARLSRLGSLKNSKHLKLLFMPLLERIFKSASNLGDAMLARGYTEKRNSYFNVIELGYHDYLSFALLSLFIFFILYI